MQSASAALLLLLLLTLGSLPSLLLLLLLLLLSFSSVLAVVGAMSSSSCTRSKYPSSCSTMVVEVTETEFHISLHRYLNNIWQLLQQSTRRNTYTSLKINIQSFLNTLHRITIAATEFAMEGRYRCNIRRS